MYSKCCDDEVNVCSSENGDYYVCDKCLSCCDLSIFTAKEMSFLDFTNDLSYDKRKTSKALELAHGNDKARNAKHCETI